MDLSAATQKLVHSNQLDDESFTQKKIAQAFQDLVSVDLGMDEDAVNRAAALRRGKRIHCSFLLSIYFNWPFVWITAAKGIGDATHNLVANTETTSAPKVQRKIA